MMKGQRHTVWRTGAAGLVCAAGAVAWILCSGGAQSVAGGEAELAQTQFPELVALALQVDEVTSRPTIKELRRRGPESIKYLMGQPDLRTLPRWSAVLDAVAQQKDAQYSGLYWYTDLNQALEVAKRDKKPVLSLRLLGKLTDELSCANSRFFRTTLYPNPKVHELLANQFVLHWQSVRAVPIITIDFGDGRQIKRTITGNSLHLVLDGQGRSLDVLPGLYTAEHFVRELQQAGPMAVRLGELDEHQFLAARIAYHRDRLKIARQAWNEVCQKANITDSLPLDTDHPAEIWTTLAAFDSSQPVLEGNAQRAVLERSAPAAEVAGRIAITKMRVETPAMRLLRNVSQIIREDSLRNEFLLHFQIHNWFASGQTIPQSEQLVGRVYSELFLSPLNDPWYGLSQPDVYSALENDGRINAVAQNPGH